MPPRPIALLTDFGTGDPYVAAMKGVILSRLPGALVVDITHEVPRHDVVSAAYHLRCVEPYFPAGTIFLCVVDPGVGTGRPILCLERGKRTFIAPGNGMLDLLAAGTPGERWLRLRSPAATDAISSTFHGRDLFAPAAARLAGGAGIRTIARPIDPVPSRPMFVDLAPNGTASVKGSVVHVDHFGNVITNIRTGPRTDGEWSARIAGSAVRGFFRTYEEAPPGKLFLLRGSSGLLEISIRRGDAAKALRAAPGTPLTLRVT